MIHVKRSGILWYFVLFVTYCFGQELPVIHRINDNPSKSAITCIFEDDHGFIWYGTRHGLYRYDGLNFEKFIHEIADRSSISGNRIEDAIKDQNNNIWITGDGLGFFDPKTGIFSALHFDAKASIGIHSNFTTALFEDVDGLMWIGSEDAGLLRFDPTSKKNTHFAHDTTNSISLSSNNVTQIIKDRSQNLWVSTYDNGINLFDPSNETFRKFTFEDSLGLLSNSILSMHQGKDALWIGTKKGIYELVNPSPGNFSFKSIKIPGNPLATAQIAREIVLSILEDSKGNLWVGTEGNGLYLIDLNKGKVDILPYDHSIISNTSIWSLFEDSNGIIWIGTYANGLNKIDPLHIAINNLNTKIDIKNTLRNKITSSFVTDSTGNVYIATDGDGLRVFDPATGTIKQTYQSTLRDKMSIASDAILDLHLDKSGSIWVSTWNGGLSLLNPKSHHFKNFPVQTGLPNSLSGDGIFDIEEDGKGNLWLAVYQRGIDIFNVATGEFKKMTADINDSLSLSSSKVKVIKSIGAGEFFIGTENAGVDHIRVDEKYRIIYKKNYGHNADEPASLSYNVISDIMVDTKKRIWIATYGGGLNLYNKSTDTFTKYSTKNGLSNDLVVSLIEDFEGNIWVGTSDGLCRLNEHGEIDIFDMRDGLINDEYYFKSAYIDPSGKLYFGGRNGFDAFYPNEILINKKVPKIYLTEFQVAGNASKSTKKGQLLDARYPDQIIELTAQENDIQFGWALLNYSHPLKNRFAYRLENHDLEWKTIKNGQDITYMNLPPGHYILKTKGSNNNGIWNEAGSSINIHVARPWYASYMAYFVYSLMIVMGLVFGRRIILNRERLKNHAELERLRIVKLQEIYEMKSKFFVNIAHEFRTPLSLILGPLKSLLNNSFEGNPKKVYRIMERNADRLLRLINQILELSKLDSGTMKLEASLLDIVKFLRPIAYSFNNYAEKQFINYKCEFPNKEILLFFEPDKVEKIVINILSNAFKYTPEFGRITFSLQADDRQVYLKFNDSGVGIEDAKIPLIFDRFYQANSNQKGTGIGLALTRELIDLHKGSVDVKSVLNEGSCFKVTFKLGRDHLNDDQILSETPNPIISMDNWRLRKNPDSEKIEIIHESQASELQELPIVLIVEDDDDMRLFISEYLITHYQVMEASNGHAALKIAREQIPDIIISDIKMPEMNGYELIRNLRSDEKTSHIPIIIVTAKVSNESIEKGLELGADYYVTKPFNPKLLELRIKNLLITRNKIRTQFGMINEPPLEPKDVMVPSKDNLFLKKVIACVEQNMADSNFGVDEICRDLGMSRTQLYRKLKGLVGQSANEFIRSFRLKRAAQLLGKQQMTIAEITYKVGFNDLQYFRYCFKNQFGVNPSEYTENS